MGSGPVSAAEAGPSSVCLPPVTVLGAGGALPRGPGEKEAHAGRLTGVNNVVFLLVQACPSRGQLFHLAGTLSPRSPKPPPGHSVKYSRRTARLG